MEFTQEHYRLGEVAYNAYCKQAGGKSLVSGERLPGFSALRSDIRDAWAASVIALSLHAEMAVRRAASGLEQKNLAIAEVLGYIQRRYQPGGSPPPGDWMVVIDWIMAYQMQRGGQEALVPIMESARDGRECPEWLDEELRDAEQRLGPAKTWTTSSSGHGAR